MSISRRNFFHQIAVGSAASAATSHLYKLAQAASERRLGSSRLGGPIRLDMNVNPYGPSPKVLEVIRANLNLINRYPDGEYRSLVERIADFHNVTSSQVTLAAGSREVLRTALITLSTRGSTLVLASPTYAPMIGLAKQAGVEVIAVPINKRYAHDLDLTLERTNASTGLVYICNPNNPTGSLTPRKDIETFLRKLAPSVPVIIDEAYHEYVAPTSDYASFIGRPIDDERVIVVRTFSKIYGLAGLRLGYAISSNEMSRKLALRQTQSEINIVATRSAAAALDDSEYIRLSSHRNANQRQEFYNQTNARMLRQVDSVTNFVFTKTGLPSSQVIEHFERNGITLGPVVPEMDRYVRVAIGTEENMEEFWRVWGLLPSMSHKMASKRFGHREERS